MKDPTQTISLEEWQRLISVLRNARNLLADVGYLYVKDIDKLLEELDPQKEGVD